MVGTSGLEQAIGALAQAMNNITPLVSSHQGALTGVETGLPIYNGVLSITGGSSVPFSGTAYNAYNAISTQQSPLTNSGFNTTNNMMNPLYAFTSPPLSGSTGASPSIATNMGYMGNPTEFLLPTGGTPWWTNPQVVQMRLYPSTTVATAANRGKTAQAVSSHKAGW